MKDGTQGTTDLGAWCKAQPGPPSPKGSHLCPHPKTQGLHASGSTAGAAALGVKHCPLQGILELGSGSLGVTWSALFFLLQEGQPGCEVPVRKRGSPGRTAGLDEFDPL